jgi:hypothetical protein
MSSLTAPRGPPGHPPRRSIGRPGGPPDVQFGRPRGHQFCPPGVQFDCPQGPYLQHPGPPVSVTPTDCREGSLVDRKCPEQMPIGHLREAELVVPGGHFSSSGGHRIEVPVVPDSTSREGVPEPLEPMPGGHARRALWEVPGGQFRSSGISRLDVEKSALFGQILTQKVGKSESKHEKVTFRSKKRQKSELKLCVYMGNRVFPDSIFKRRVFPVYLICRAKNSCFFDSF